MRKKMSYMLAAVAVVVGLLVPQPAAAAPNDRRIVYTNGLDGHAISVNPDGSDRRDYGPGYSPKLSPDGSKIALARDGADGTTRDLYVVNADGSNLRKLSENINTQGSPAQHFSWSPDSTKLVHTTEYGAAPGTPGGEHKQIAVVHADGTNKVQLTNEPANTWNINPMWSPDGTRILYVRTTTGSAVYMMNADGSNQHQVVANAADASWSPDATKILFSESGVGIRTANADGSGRATLAVVGTYAKWSPDGSRIVLESPECDCSQTPSAIVTVKPDGTDRKIIATPPTAGGVGQPAWSPDSAKVIFTEWARWESPRLVVKPVSGGDGSVVVMESAGNPQWAYLAYTPPQQQYHWQFNLNLQAELQAYVTFTSKFVW